MGKYRALLVITFLLILVATVAIALLGAIQVVKISEYYENWLLASVVLEVTGCMIIAFKSVTAGFDNPPQVKGIWNYECIRADGSYAHGGEATIDLFEGEFGWEFSISGQRYWTAEKKDGRWVKDTLQIPFQWNSKWGTFTGDDVVHYTYSITTMTGVVEGYGTAVIQGSKRKPKLMIGKFYQLPPFDPFYGKQSWWSKSIKVPPSEAPVSRFLAEVDVRSTAQKLVPTRN